MCESPASPRSAYNMPEMQAVLQQPEPHYSSQAAALILSHHPPKMQCTVDGTNCKTKNADGCTCQTCIDGYGSDGKGSCTKVSLDGSTCLGVGAGRQSNVEFQECHRLPNGTDLCPRKEPACCNSSQQSAHDLAPLCSAPPSPSARPTRPRTASARLATSTLMSAAWAPVRWAVPCS